MDRLTDEEVHVLGDCLTEAKMKKMFNGEVKLEHVLSQRVRVLETLLSRGQDGEQQPRFSKRERETLAMAVLLLAGEDAGDETRLEILAMLSDSAPSEGNPQ